MYTRIAVGIAAALLIAGPPSALGKTSEAECTTQFDKVDLNKDGRLQPNEADVYILAMEKAQLKPQNVLEVTRTEFLVACRKDAFANVTAPSGSRTAQNQSTSGGEQALAAPPQGVLVSSLIGTDVYAKDDQVIGKINDVILDHANPGSDRAIISVGGFLGIGEKDVVLNRSRLNFLATNSGVRVVVDTTKEELQKLPTVTKQKQ